MIKTYGLTHIALQVMDVQRSSEFYHRVFGTREMYRSAGFIQVQTPGSHDIIVFQKSDSVTGSSGGIVHFGFRLAELSDIAEMVELIKAAGGRIKEQGEFCPGEPYVFFYDPDGYEVEVCYEKLQEGSDFN